MIITSKVNMDLQQSGFVPAIHAVQDDRYSRNIELSLYSGGESWTIPETASAVVCYSKSDGKGGEYDTLPDGTQAWTAAENVLTIALAPQVLTAAGPVYLSVSLINGEAQLSTFHLLLNVEAAVNAAIGESEDYFYVTGFLPAPTAAEVGQYFRVTSVDEHGRVKGVEAVNLDAVSYAAQTLTEEQKAQARENIGAAEAKSSDEERLAEGFTLTSADFIYGVWNGELDANSETPYHTTDIGDQFCTRRLQTTKLPIVRKVENTNIHQIKFWKDKVFVATKTWDELSANWSVDFEFDEVAMNFSWNWANAATQVIVMLCLSQSVFGKVLVIGDSLSADYYGSYSKWVTNLIEEGFFPANTNNDSIHATGYVAEYTAEGDVDNNFVHRIEAVTDKDTYDLVIVFGGTNDYSQAIPMGTGEDDKTANFVPAVDYFFSYLVNNFTHARIVVLTPMRTYANWENSVGCFETEYADYIRTVAKSFCLPVLDLAVESGFCPFNENFKAMWTLIPAGYTDADGIHPNEEYQKKFLAPMIRNFLLQFI